MVSTLISIYFGSPRLLHTVKSNCIKFEATDLEMLNFDFLEKDLRLVYPHHLCMIFREEYFLCYILLTDQMSLGISEKWDLRSRTLGRPKNQDAGPL